jgi:hypothetical protein
MSDNTPEYEAADAELRELLRAGVTHEAQLRRATALQLQLQQSQDQHDSEPGPSNRWLATGRALFNKYIGLAFPIRLMITSIASAFVGSSVLGFLAEYASYTYALYYGIRPPVEGIPYLRASVTALSFSVSILGISAFAACYWFLRSLVGRVEGYINLARRTGTLVKISGLDNAAVDEAIQIFRARPIKTILRWMIILSVAAVLVSTAVTAAQGYGIAFILKTAALVAGWAALFTLLVVLNWKPTLVPYLATFLAAVMMIVAPLLLFQPSRYAWLLRRMGYGGGFPVQVNVGDIDGSTAEEISGVMLLRTTDAVILLDSSGTKIIDIPIAKVRRLRHDTDALRGDNYFLPRPVR